MSFGDKRLRTLYCLVGRDPIGSWRKAVSSPRPKVLITGDSRSPEMGVEAETSRLGGEEAAQQGSRGEAERNCTLNFRDARP